MSSCTVQTNKIGVMTKPPNLLLPPKFLHENYFHEAIIKRYRHLQCFFDTSYELIWHTVIVRTFPYRDEGMLDHTDLNQKLDLIKNFCSSIKGIHSYNETNSIDVNINKDLLYLEGIKNIPLNVFDDSFMDELKVKYHCRDNVIVDFMSERYILLDIYSKDVRRNQT